jgi:hypothetical protein
LRSCAPRVSSRRRIVTTCQPKEHAISHPAPSADPNLLFGELALQADLIDANRFAEACTAWSARKDTPLASLVVERGWLKVFARLARTDQITAADFHLARGRFLAVHRALLVEMTKDDSVPRSGRSGVWMAWKPSSSRLSRPPAAQPSLEIDAAMGQDGHARMASAETSRNSFSVAPLAD